MLPLCPVRVGVVEELHRIQPLQSHVPDIGDSVICVQGLFEPQIGFAGVGTDELQSELGTETIEVKKTQFSLVKTGESKWLSKHSNATSRT